jgi:hypothetical protein
MSVAKIFPREGYAILMPDPQVLDVFLDQIAKELDRLRHRTALVSQLAATDLSVLVGLLDAAVTEARAQAKDTPAGS